VSTRQVGGCAVHNATREPQGSPVKERKSQRKGHRRQKRGRTSTIRASRHRRGGSIARRRESPGPNWSVRPQSSEEWVEQRAHQGRFTSRLGARPVDISRDCTLARRREIVAAPERRRGAVSTRSTGAVGRHLGTRVSGREVGPPRFGVGGGAARRRAHHLGSSDELHPVDCGADVNRCAERLTGRTRTLSALGRHRWPWTPR